MGEWEPDATFRVAQSEAFLWVVPARVEGRWTLQDEAGFFSGEVELVQRFQRVGGTLTLRGKPQPLLGAYVEGEHLGFTFVGLDGGVRSVRARIDGASAVGGAALRGKRHRRYRTPTVIGSASSARRRCRPRIDQRSR